MRNIQWIWFCMCGSVSACASGVFSCIEHRLRTNAYLLKLKLSTNSLTFCFYCLWNTNKNKQKPKTKVSTFDKFLSFTFLLLTHIQHQRSETAALFHVPTLKKHEYNSPFIVAPLLAFCHNNWECAFIHLHIPHIHTYVCIYIRMCAWMFPVFLYAQIQYFLPSVKKNASVQFISVAVYVCFICFLRFGPLAFRVLRVCVSVCAFCLIFFSITFCFL